MPLQDDEAKLHAMLDGAVAVSGTQVFTGCTATGTGRQIAPYIVEMPGQQQCAYDPGTWTDDDGNDSDYDFNCDMETGVGSLIYRVSP